MRGATVVTSQKTPDFAISIRASTQEGQAKESIFMRPTIEMRSGYKYARCMQCGKWCNVCMQFTGWYVCPKCRCRKENEHGRKEETH